MSTNAHRGGRWLAACLLAGALVAAGPGPADGRIKKPEIVKAWANTEGGELVFTVKVSMGKGKRSFWDVDVTYRGAKRDSTPYRTASTLFETDPFPVANRQCYRIKVKATNKRGTTTRRLNAGKQSTNGCLRDRRP